MYLVVVESARGGGSESIEGGAITFRLGMITRICAPQCSERRWPGRGRRGARALAYEEGADDVQEAALEAEIGEAKAKG